VEARSRPKIAAPSVDATIAPTSRPSTVESPNSADAATPAITAVTRVPSTASVIAGPSTGLMVSMPVVRPPSKRISARAMTPIVRARP
jgi:hypothetical protein